MEFNLNFDFEKVYYCVLPDRKVNKLGRVYYPDSKALCVRRLLIRSVTLDRNGWPGKDIHNDYALKLVGVDCEDRDAAYPNYVMVDGLIAKPDSEDEPWYEVVKDVPCSLVFETYEEAMNVINKKEN